VDLGTLFFAALAYNMIVGYWWIWGGSLLKLGSMVEAAGGRKK
jgi:hypothetical protein